MAAGGRSEVVRRFYAALSRGDLDGACELSAPDAVFDWSASMAPYRGVYVGMEGMRRLWGDVLAAVEDVHFEIEEAEEHGEQVLVMVRVTMRGRGGGVPVVARGPHLWTIRGERVTAFRLFQQREDAQRALETAADEPPPGAERR